MGQVTLAMAAGAGVVSFLSPCVLPLVPGYLSFVAGVSASELHEEDRRMPLVVWHTVAFVLGFSLVFVLLGASATAAGAFLLANHSFSTGEVMGLSLTVHINQRIFAQWGGLIVVLFGLHTLGIIKIPLLYQEKRFQVVNRPAGWLGSFLIGLAFAFGWTPCIGPILAAILSLAATQDTIFSGVELLVAYSLGLAVPFLLTALAFNRLLAVFDQVKRHMRAVEVISGALLLGVGFLLISNGLGMVSGWIQAVPLLSKLSI